LIREKYSSNSRVQIYEKLRETSCKNKDKNKIAELRTKKIDKNKKVDVL